MLDNKTILVGYSGHGFVVADAALEAGLSLIGFIDLEDKKINPYNLSYLGKDEDLNKKYLQWPYRFILGIGDNILRQKVALDIENKSGEIISIIHPKAIVSNTVKIKKGTFVSANATINCLVKIGVNCIINTGCIIEHECHIADNVHIAPGAVLAGEVKVGDNTFIGANAVIKQGVKIGANVLVGAGTVIINDVPDNSKFVGNPGREI